jgi:hypothetical protein
VLDIDEIKSVHYVPLSHPFIERLIGTIRREYLDHVLFWNQFDLQRKLEDFKVYYNQRRVHCSLDGNTPHEQGGHSPSKLAVDLRMQWPFADTKRSLICNSPCTGSDTSVQPGWVSAR